MDSNLSLGNDASSSQAKKDEQIDVLEEENESLKEKLVEAKDKISSLKDQLKAAAKKGDSGAEAVKVLSTAHEAKVAEFEQKLGTPYHTAGLRLKIDQCLRNIERFSSDADRRIKGAQICTQPKGN